MSKEVGLTAADNPLDGVEHNLKIDDGLSIASVLRTNIYYLFILHFINKYFCNTHNKIKYNKKWSNYTGNRKY